MALQTPSDEDGEETCDWLVGLDFGTTFSAAAICYRGKANVYCPPGEIKHLDLYPYDSSYRRCREVPSELRYEKSLLRWGYDVSAASKQIGQIPGHQFTRFKLLLDESTSSLSLRTEVQKALMDLPGEKTGEQVISDYLTELLGHVQWFMSRSLNYKSGEPIELACTVPAMWSQPANARMVFAIEEAKKRAKFGRNAGKWEPLRLVPEPEAAAFHIFTHHRNLGLKVGTYHLFFDKLRFNMSNRQVTRSMSVMQVAALWFEPFNSVAMSKSETFSRIL